MTLDELKRFVHRNTKNLAYFKEALTASKKNASRLVARTTCDVCKDKGKNYVFDIDPDAPFVGKTKSSHRAVVCPKCLESATE